MKHYLITICLMLMLSACGAQNKIYNLEKEGIVYNYSEKVYFYYPRNWNLEADSVKLSLDIYSDTDEEALFFDSFEITGSNSPEELLELYIKKLESVGIVVEKNEEKHLDSQQPCFVLSGYNSSGGQYFSEVVVFFDGTQYIYSYIATREVYEKNISVMQLYLESLVINEIQKAG